MDTRSCRLLVLALSVGAATILPVVVVAPAQAATVCTAVSGAATLPLVELFTSEGCSSCPPADRWLSSSFPPQVASPTASVLAFHVDYWDRLGWKDRFASAAYTDRQYAAMRASGAAFVYTPQLLVQGRDAQFNRGSRAPDLLAAARALPARATIALESAVAENGATTARVRTTVPDTALRANAVVWLAYTDNALVSEVEAGENHGVHLTHDHVIRALSSPYPVDASGEVKATVTWPRPAERGRGTAIVAVVQDTKSGDVLQTLTLPACGG